MNENAHTDSNDDRDQLLVCVSPGTVTPPIQFELSTLESDGDVACLDDYDDDTDDAKCLWNFSSPNGLIAHLYYRLPGCAYDCRFIFDGKIIEGSHEHAEFLASKLPMQDKELVEEWATAYHEGGMERAWQVDVDPEQRAAGQTRTL